MTGKPKVPPPPPPPPPRPGDEVNAHTNPPKTRAESFNGAVVPRRDEDDSIPHDSDD